MMNILTAEQAKQQSDMNQKEPLEPIMLFIDEASRNGNYHVVIDCIIAPCLVEKLKELGYAVMFDTSAIHQSTIISWDEI